MTFAPDDIDWDDEVRVAVEERASMSPDALTGMEANLRFVGPETLKPKSLVVYLLGRTGYFNARMLLVPTGLSRHLVNQHRHSLTGREPR